MFHIGATDSFSISHGFDMQQGSFSLLLSLVILQEKVRIFTANKKCCPGLYCFQKKKTVKREVFMTHGVIVE